MKAKPGHHPNQIKARIKPGQVLNPKGGAVVPEALREARKLSNEQFGEVAQMLLTNNLDGLKAISKDKTQPAFKAVFAKSILEAYKWGNYDTLEKMITRLHGRPKETIEIKNGDKFENMSEQELQAAQDKIQSLIKNGVA